MQSYTVLVLVVLVAAVTSEERQLESWEKVDRHQIIDSDRLFNNYKRCLITSSTTGCTPDLLKFKKKLYEWVKNACDGCSDSHLAIFKDTIEYICLKRPDSWPEIIAALDPEGTYSHIIEEKHGKLSESCSKA